MVLSILSGGNRVSKAEIFSHDSLVQQLLGLESKVDENTIHYRFDKFKMRHSNELIDIILQISKKVHQFLKFGDYEIIDCDSTEKTVYGNQEGARKGYNPYKKGKKSLHPLMAFLNSSKECLLSYLRPGNAYTSNNMVNFLKQLRGNLPEVFPRYLLRMDSGFFSGDILDEIEKDPNADFLCKVKLKNITGILETQEWKKSRRGFEEADFEYRCNGWKKARKFKAVRKLVKIEPGLFSQKKYAYFCFVSNLEKSPLEIYELYKPRATSENWIEAAKNQMFAGNMVKQKFWATEGLYQCSILAYNLSVWLRKATDEKSFQEEPATFREWFIRLPGKLVSSSRRMTLKLYKYYWDKKRWLKIYLNLQNLEFS